MKVVVKDNVLLVNDDYLILPTHDRLHTVLKSGKENLEAALKLSTGPAIRIAYLASVVEELLTPKGQANFQSQNSTYSAIRQQDLRDRFKPLWITVGTFRFRPTIIDWTVSPNKGLYLAIINKSR